MISSHLLRLSSDSDSASGSGSPELFPGALGDAAVAILHATVLVKRGHGPQPLVVQALEPEPLLEVAFDSVQRLEFVRQRPCTTASWKAATPPPPPCARGRLTRSLSLRSASKACSAWSSSASAGF